MQDTDEACLDKLSDTVMQEAAILHRHGLLADPQSVREKLTITGDLVSALTGADFIQENGPERIEIKRSLFEALDQLAPSNIPIASSTSAIIASQFTEELSGRHRCFVGHPVNPPIWFHLLNCAARLGHHQLYWIKLIKSMQSAVWFLSE